MLLDSGFRRNDDSKGTFAAKGHSGESRNPGLINRKTTQRIFCDVRLKIEHTFSIRKTVGSRISASCAIVS